MPDSVISNTFTLLLGVTCHPYCHCTQVDMTYGHNNELSLLQNELVTMETNKLQRFAPSCQSRMLQNIKRTWHSKKHFRDHYCGQWPKGKTYVVRVTALFCFLLHLAMKEKRKKERNRYLGFSGSFSAWYLKMVKTMPKTFHWNQDKSTPSASILK